MVRKRHKSSKNAGARSRSDKPAKTQASTVDLRSRLSSTSRRTWLLGGAACLAAAGGATTLHAWDVRNRDQHDLSVIGGGEPVVVQIHDRSCGICRRLKGAMEKATADRADIQFRIADIAQDDGRELQERYDLPKTSLLFFDGSGSHLHSHTGLLNADEVTQMIDEVLSQLADIQS